MFGYNTFDSHHPKQDQWSSVDIAVIKLYVAKHKYNKPALMSYELNGNTFGIWLSHRGCARVSDACREYPEAIQSFQLPRRMKAYALVNDKKLPKELLKKCKLYV